MTRPTAKASTSKNRSKKAYEPPRLTVYGSVKKITNMAKRRRVSDGVSRRT